MKLDIFRIENNIGRRLILLIIAFSSVITLLLTAVQLYFDYYQQRNDLDQQIEEIHIYVPSITGSVWAFDDSQINLALDALARLPNINQVTVATSDRKKQWQAGQPLSDHIIAKIYPLHHVVKGTQTEIGTLEVIASLDGIYVRLIEHALTIFGSNALKTFLMAAFMVLLFRRVVTDRLKLLANDAGKLMGQVMPDTNHIKNDHLPLPDHLDELDAVRWAFDDMRNQLSQAVDALRYSNEELQLENAERQMTQDALRISADEIEDLYSNAPCGYHSVDGNGIYVRINNTELKWLGYTREEIIGKKKFADVLTQNSQKTFYEHLAKLMETGFIQDIEYDMVRKDGSILPVLLSASAVRGAGDQYLMSRATLFDITERKRHETELAYQATHDALTGMPNRTLLNARIEMAIAQARRNQLMAAVIFFDLDNFKYINDSLGHDVGDDLLQQVAARLKSSLREVDAIARYGGDEFVVVLADIQRDDAVIGFAAKIVDSMRQSFMVNGQEQFVTTSLGISVFPKDGQDMQTLLRNADMAMYRAKDLGRNNFQFFSHDMNVHVSQRLMLENEMRHALDRNEFMLCYQPQADARTGRVNGMEALLRWQHPALGLVPPQKFIGLAEETGLIVSIGEWVIREACRQNKAWQSQGLPMVKVAVNLSARQFRQHDLVEIVSDILEETGLEPQYLELELTESMIMHDHERVIQVLDRLSALGVSLALDDFGTGYSSLSYLKRFPIDKIKIDKSFVDNITTDPDDAAIAKAIISIAHEMKMSVIAEGAETEEQVVFLQEQNCDSIQGYYFCKPIAPTELVKFLKQESLLKTAGLGKELPA